MKTKTNIFILIFTLFISCSQNNTDQTLKTNVSTTDTLVNNSIDIGGRIELSKYVNEGIFLKGEIRLFDNNQKIIGKLNISEIEPIQIIEKSIKMFNLGDTTDKCQKAYFLKIKYKNTEYFVFGDEVYEINKKQRFTTYNEKKEKLTLFPITNFKMGASDEEGLTQCDDYSILVLFNENKNHYLLIKYPENEERDKNPYLKYALLFHDDGAEDKIYKVTMIKDTLVIGIKTIGQEGGGAFNIKAKLTSDFPKSFITDEIRYELDEDLYKLDKLK
ncbi:MAG: hypothetical protein ACOYOV_10435 [Bacteroidales bacterium]